MGTQENYVITLVVLLAYTCCTSSSTVHRNDFTKTTIPPPTTVPPGCFYHNKYYPPGSLIENGYDPSTNWCYGTHCDMNGQLQNWDDFNCRTTPPTTIPPTTIPGCLYNGKYYSLGSTIDKGYDPDSNWCYGTYCDTNGQILHGDDFNCVKTTTGAPTTTLGPPQVG
ncbi:uncharacterized protein LOC128547097 [Mercenaria mercenaria]|uniref:uncharacterized protein LOC128547097 n=1 Tax=Mercenaria mercenaria TaxID=6596 RepID=UPI00234E861B|nr:uncharacterized protein LOC128547097 [Mercenaria mercenaria]